MFFPDDLYEPYCERCDQFCAYLVDCADDDSQHCEDCADQCPACLADKDEQRRVDAARKGE